MRLGSACFIASSACVRSPALMAASTLRTAPATRVRRDLLIAVRRAILRAAYAGWHPQVQRIIDEVDETFIWAVLDREPLTRWTYDRVTMMGDACHPMLPFMGQGGAQAIEDAVAITACLRRCGDDVLGALKLYETVRLPRASQVQNMSWENKTRFHMPDGPAQVQRDAMMAKGMTDWAYRAVAWVYGHDASVLPDSSGGAAIPGHAIPGH
jgi:salicylate hydroxylase